MTYERYVLALSEVPKTFATFLKKDILAQIMSAAPSFARRLNEFWQIRNAEISCPHNKLSE